MARGKKFSKAEHLARTAKCDNVMETVRLVRILCDEIEQSREAGERVMINNVERGKLLVALNREKLAQKRLEVLERFCKTHNF